jgi:hypothetical protein
VAEFFSAFIRFRLRSVYSLLLVVVILLIHTASAPLLMTGFALFDHLLKLRALLGRQDGDHLLAHASHALPHLCAKLLRAGCGVRRKLSLVALAKTAHLFALGLDICFVTIMYGAKLLLLSVRQVKLAEESHDSSTTTLAHPAAMPAPALPLLLRIILLGGLLLREGGGVEGQDEAERQAGSG